MLSKFSLPVMGLSFLAVPAFAQSTNQLPVDASNCAILRALAPDAASPCNNTASNGLARGIVLRLDEQLNAQEAEDLGKVIKPTKPKVSIATKPAAKPVTIKTASLEPTAKPAHHAAAKSQNGYFIQFAFGSFDLEPDYRAHMERLSAVLSSDAMASTCIRVTGHTDTVGSEEYNKKLGENRAVIVASFLAEGGKINPTRIQIASAGETKPLPDIKGEDPLNRRVEFSTKESSDGCN